METQTCANCLCTIYLDEYNNVWLHVVEEQPECHPDDSPGTYAEPRW